MPPVRPMMIACQRYDPVSLLTSEGKASGAKVTLMPSLTKSCRRMLPMASRSVFPALVCSVNSTTFP